MQFDAKKSYIKDSIIRSGIMFMFMFDPHLLIAAESENTATLGAGVGFLSNGLGVNIGLKNESSLRYISLGCFSISSSDSRGTETNCGLGGGWMTTYILNQKNNNHSLGIHLGVTHDNRINKNESRLGITYVYFFNGINGDGWNLGLSPTVEKRDEKTETVLMVQAGYQF